ncbi:hypothetical protein ACFC00_29295 [Streptomyces adustus]|uniref:hypothetical protein n=1 Tax=Streptomyces adustus TaxID=1609272 RepID=UPI0035DBBE95
MPDLSTWLKGMRLIVHTERPHPGALLRFTDIDGHGLTCFATNTKRKPTRWPRTASLQAGPL